MRLVLLLIAFALFFEAGQWLRRPVAARAEVDPVMGPRPFPGALLGALPIAALTVWLALPWLGADLGDGAYLALVVFGVGGFALDRVRVWWSLVRVTDGGARVHGSLARLHGSLALELAGLATVVILAIGA